MKKGEQYSHHTGTARQCICDYLDEVRYFIDKNDNQKALKALGLAQKHLSNLGEQIAALDILNGFK